MKVFVLGGGPAGLALVDGLGDMGDVEFVLIERNASLGGLAQTLKWKEHGSHDLGPHKIFTLDQNLLARVKALLPEGSWLTRPKKSSIWMKGHYLPYPPSPFSLMGVYGLKSFANMTAGFAFARVSSIFSRNNAKTFEDDVQTRIGNGLYQTLFKPIALKLWGDPKELDVKLSKGRVQVPSVIEIVKTVLGMKKKESDFEALEFIYPRGGLQRLWDSIRTKSESKGKFLLNREVKGFEVKNNKISEIVVSNRETNEEERVSVAEGDFVFSTLPLAKLCELLGSSVSEATKAKARDIVALNDLLLVFLKLDKPSLLEESWVFIPDPGVVFHRISEQESFDPGMTPGGTILCCEVMSNAMRPMEKKSDAELISMVKAGLKDMGYEGFQVMDERVIRLPKSYPVFRPGFEKVLEEILSDLDKLENFRTIGRQGAFNYIGTLDAMDIGYGSARWLAGNVNRDIKASWKEERTRTSFYPVLD